MDHCSAVFLGVELPDGFDDGLKLFQSQLRVHGQGEDFFGGALADGEVAWFVAEELQALLQVKGLGVVDFGADGECCEVVAQGVAAGRSDDVLVEDVFGAGIGVGENDSVGGGFACEACGG